MMAAAVDRGAVEGGACYSMDAADADEAKKTSRLKNVWLLLTSDHVLAIYSLCVGVLMSIAPEAFKAFGREQDISKLMFIAGAVCLGPVFVAIIVGAMERRRMKKKLQEAHYESINFHWTFSANGDFEGRYVFEFVNGSNAVVALLPTFNIIVWGKSVPTKVQFRVLNSEHSLSRFEESGHKIIETVSKLLNRGQSLVEFGLAVYPALKQGEHFSYEISVELAKSETDAFTPKGTILGIPVPIPIRHASLHCVAPLNYKFALIKGVRLVDMKGDKTAGKPGKKIPSPQLAPGGGSLTWELDDPPPQTRYWQEYRFEEAA